MYNCLVTVARVENGIYYEGVGMRNAAKGLLDLGEIKDGEENVNTLRSLKMWSVVERDVPAFVEQLSQQWVGYEVKVYSLTGVSVRMAGELKNKSVTKDGVLPV